MDGYYGNQGNQISPDEIFFKTNPLEKEFKSLAQSGPKKRTAGKTEFRAC